MFASKGRKSTALESAQRGRSTSGGGHSVARKAANDRTPAADGTAADVVGSSGEALDADVQSWAKHGLERRFHFALGDGIDLSNVRVHTDGRSAESARSMQALAYTFGDHIVFGEGQYQPATSDGRRLIAHELAHVAQQSAAGGAAPSPSAMALPVSQPVDPLEQEAERVAEGMLEFGMPGPVSADPALTPSVGLTRQSLPALQRYAVNAIMVARPGDTLPIQVKPSYKDPDDPLWSGRFLISPDGFITFNKGTAQFAVQVGGLSLVDAAERIADAFFDHAVFADPSVTVTSVDGYGAAGSGSKKAGLSQQRALYRDYVKDSSVPAEALRRYQKWVDAHSTESELAATTPAQVWGAALQEPLIDPRDTKIDEFVRFMSERLNRALSMQDGDDRRQAVEALRRFEDWFDSNKEARGFLKRDPAKIYADFQVQVLKEEIDKKVTRDVAVAKQKALEDAEPFDARQQQWEAFYALALELWGFTARTYPYRLPMPSEGKDILVWGQPEVQKVLTKAANDLMSYATDHLFDTGYTKLNPRSVLADVIKAGKYGAALKEAQNKPLDHETIDRNEIVPEKALAAFGETVATGLFVIAVVAVFVGAEVITAGQATWILVGVAGAGGVKSFLDRREEIEKKGYDVPIPATIVHSAGDAIGVSQLVEGITGTRLGTDVPLGSDARSQQFGVGTGNVATFLLGSRAFKVGEAFGAEFKPPKPIQLPSGPNANVKDVNIPTNERPATPKPSAKPGTAESTARGGLPKDMQLGFDKWMEDIRARGGDPESVLSKKPAREVERIAQSFARRHAREVALAEEAEYLQQRAKDNPLRPELKNNRQIADKVWIHYETKAPGAAEIAHAIEIAKRTGETIHLFGDTASKVSYPGIDGTIGNPPRPLSLKTQGPNAVVGSARFSAQQALVKAQTHGYSQVEVEIDLPGKTVQEVKAGWDVKGEGPTAQDLGPVYDGDVIAKVTVQCSDGTFVVPKPKTPSRTSVAPNLTQPGSDKEKERH